jgi:hypothetical protein
MLLDVRTYTCKPGTIKKHQLYTKNLARHRRCVTLAYQYFSRSLKLATRMSTCISGSIKMRVTEKNAVPSYGKIQNG